MFLISGRIDEKLPYSLQNCSYTTNGFVVSEPQNVRRNLSKNPHSSDTDDLFFVMEAREAERAFTLNGPAHQSPQIPAESR